VAIKKTFPLFLYILFFAICGFSSDLKRVDDPEILALPAGDGVVLLNFWATWCEPCLKEMPMLIRIHAAEPQVKMIGISVDAIENEGAVKKFIKKHGIIYPIVLRQGKDVHSMMSQIDPDWKEGLPATFIYKDGKRIYSNIGIIEESKILEVIKSAM
jgi:thiol-disulfide isomerase/thioredoxin